MCTAGLVVVCTGDEAIHSPVAIAVVLLVVGMSPTVLDALRLWALTDMQERGWVFQGGTSPGTWYVELVDVYSSTFFRIHWLVILELMPTVLGIAASASLLMLMDLKAVELLTEREFSLDKELRSIGLSNLLSALCGGGWPCYILCSQKNVTCHRLGGRTAFVGCCLLLGILGCLFVVSSIVPRLPRALPGSLFMWLSLVFVKETIVDICSKYTHISDVFIVAIMALVVKFYSFNDGLSVGTLLAMGMFTIRYSGSQAGVRTAGDARFYRSICTREGSEHDALEKLGHLIAVVHVDGFLMFASTPAFTDAVRELMGPEGPDWILLNCQNLQGLDYSAALELATLGRKAKECQRRIVVTELPSGVRDVLAKAKVEMAALPRTSFMDGNCVDYGLFYQPHYQRALQRCEDGVLAPLGLRMPGKSQAALLGSEEVFMKDLLKRYIGDFLPEAASLDRALKVFSKRTLEPGSVLWHAGEECTFCVCVTEGVLHAMQPASKAPPGAKHAKDRLCCIAGPGDFIGFMAMINHFPYEHTVLVPCESDAEDDDFTIVLVLEKSKYNELFTSDPPLAQALSRGFLRQISYEWRELSRLGGAA
ncbi:unnamed protein product [Effrenium voratum]|nr:unnamed protein product [Effrenium voratum]